jgi:hypothetical protein
MQVPTFHQGGVTASDAEGVAVQVSGISWTTLGESVPVRLGPGEYVEINTPGVGLGSTAGREPWAGPRVGFNVLAKAGDEITLTHSPVPLDGSEGGIRDGVPPVVGAGWWLAHIRARLSRELPLPSAVVEREHLLQRVVNELFAASPTAEERAAFTTDQTSGALDALARRLAERTGAVEFAGKLAPPPIRFRVLAADPAAAEGPRVVLGPGEYPIGKGATLRIVGRPDGERYIYDARILFEPAEVTGKLPPDPHKIEMPGDRATWAIVCRPGAGHFYVLHRGTARKIDYTNPLMVTDAPATDLPAGFRDEAKRQLDFRGVSAESQAEVFEKPAPPAASSAPKDAETLEAKARNKIAKLTPDTLLGAWRGTVNQERLMVSFHRPPAEQDVQCDIYFGEATIGALARFVIADDGGSAEVIQHSAGGGMKFGTLLPIEPGKLKLELYGRQKGQQEVILERVPEGAAVEPRQAEPRELFKIWKATANEDGTIPGAFIDSLATEVRAYVKANPTRSSAMDLPKLLPRFVTSRNWTQAEAIQLLDDVAYYAPALPFTRAGTAAKATKAKPGPGPAMLPEAPSVPGSFPAEE